MTAKRRFFGIAAALASLALGGGASEAGAPLQRTQAPGYYRMMLGDWEVTALSDGTFPMPVEKLLIGISPQRLNDELRQSYLADPVEASVNGFLINTGSKLVLIDSGAGVLFGPTLGKLLAGLRAAGYRPDQVDEVYITHMHGDHVGGLVIGDQRAFPNAVVRAASEEADHWLSQAHLDAAAADAKGGYQAAMASLKPYVDAGKFKPFQGETELIPGLHALPAHGHTPGHTIYLAESKGQKLVLWGDLMHVAAVQFADPSVAIRYDSDTRAAIAQRRKVFAEAAAGGYWVAGAHLPFPGIGHLRANGAAFRYIPVNYSTMLP